MGWWNTLKRTAASVTTPTAGRAAMFVEATSGALALKDEAGVTRLGGPVAIALPTIPGALATGAGQVMTRLPFKLQLTAVRAHLAVAQATDGAGGILTVSVNVDGTPALSTPLTIENTETTSTTATTPAVIDTDTLDDDAEITVNIDQIGDGTAEGLTVVLIGYPIL